MDSGRGMVVPRPRSIKQNRRVNNGHAMPAMMILLVLSALCVTDVLKERDKRRMHYRQKIWKKRRLLFVFSCDILASTHRSVDSFKQPLEKKPTNMPTLIPS